MKRKTIMPLTAAVLSAAIAFAAVPAAGITSLANVIVQPGVTLDSDSSSIGPGAASLDTSGLSPDAADYASTGGAAQGVMTISSYVPYGMTSVLAQDITDPVVEAVDKYDYADLVSDLRALYARYPSYMRYKNLGATADGRYIYEAIVGSEDAGTHILITGSTHAREYITSLLVMQQLEFILQCADSGVFDGRSLKAWFNSVCLHFIPMVNPDGVTISQYGIGAVQSEYLRSILHSAFANDYTNARTTLDFDSYLVYWKANARGVNINDNFDALTQYINYVTDEPSSEKYYGTPGSEAETKILKELVDSTHFKAVINYHSKGNVIYWNYEGNPLVEHCRDLANNIWSLTGYTMLATGTEGGSFRAYLGTRSTPSTTLTIEVGAGTAPVSIDEYPTIWALNKFVPFYTMKWAAEKGK